jgi:superfamily I DNA/RNA helicase
VDIVQYQTINDEAIGIAQFVADLIDNKHYKAQDILVLAQRRSIGNPIHDALTGRNIPSKSYYQEGALDNVVAQERLAMLKLFVDSQDRIALRWLLGHGSNDFRSGAYARIRAHCEDNGVAPWDLMIQLSNGSLQLRYTQQLVTRFRDIQTELTKLTGESDVRAFVQLWLGGQIIEDDPFHALVLDLALQIESPQQLLDALLDAVSQPDIPPDVAEVRIMSLHKSKGLSSPVVIIAGCVEGLLPTAQDSDLSQADNQALLEEQRRLFFVGLTRVKAEPERNRPGTLLLTSSRSMSLADAMKSGIRPARVQYRTAYVHTSRFIRELGPAAPTPRVS